MSESDYLLWLSYESFGSILFSEGAKTIGSEVFQAPICATQAIHHLCSVETTIGIQQSNCKVEIWLRKGLGSVNNGDILTTTPAFTKYWFPNFSQVTSTQDNM